MKLSKEYSTKYIFNKLKKKWKKDTLILSSLSAICGHPSYKEIITLGWEVVPILIEELEHCPDQWFMVLIQITGENPVPSHHRGKIYEMAKDWITWWNKYQSR